MKAVGVRRWIVKGVILLGGFGYFPAGASPVKETAQLEAQFKTYLMAHPEVIVESLQAYQDKSQKQALDERDKIIQASRENLYHDGYSVVLNPQGSENVVAYLDHRCGYCKKNWPVLEQLLKSRPQVRLTIKEYPVLGELSVVLSRFALAAPQEKRSDYFKALISTQESLTKEKALEIAKSLGLDSNLLEKNADSAQISGNLEKTRILAETLGLTGTPMYIIGDHVVEGGQSLEGFEKLVDQAAQLKTGAFRKEGIKQ